MKKSEKVKGKEAVAAHQKKIKQYAIAIIAIMVVAAGIAFYFFNPYYARAGQTVSIYCTGSLEDGTVFYTNLNETPMVFTLGKGAVIRGLDDAVTGMAVNTTKTVKIPMAKAFGSYDASLVHTVNRSTLPADINPVVGERYSITRTTDNAVAHVKILNITATNVTWDENHELAGKDLTYTITLVGIVNS